MTPAWKGFLTRVQKQAKSSLFGPVGDGAGALSSLEAGGVSDEALDVLNERVAQALAVRNDGIKQHFASLDPESYTDTKEVRVWAGTYNVNGSRPRPEHDLRSWLMHPGDKWPARQGEEADWTGPDVLCVGFQEINALNAVNVVAGGGAENVNAWNTAMDCALNQKPLPRQYTSGQAAVDGLDSFTGGGALAEVSCGFGVAEALQDAADHEQYVQVGGRVLVGLYLTVWVRKCLAPHVSSWQDTDVKTGNLGFGNKGAVMVRLRVYDEPLCVMCVHLASGQQPGDDLRRQADFFQVNQAGRFDSAAAPVAGAGFNAWTAAPQFRQGKWTRSPAALQQPTVILLGDLNCRLKMPNHEVRALLKQRLYDRLLMRDELAPLLGAEGIYGAWQEAIITFPPTFKFVKGTDRYVGDLPEGASAPRLASQPGEQASPSNGRAPAAGGAGEDDAVDAASSPAGPLQASAASMLQRGPEADGDVLATSPPQPGTGACAEGPGAEAGGGSVYVVPPKTEKIRTPAWTDRVLYRASDRGKLHKILYGRSELALSDHKPVMAAFLLHAECVDAARVRDEVDAARKLLDIQANNAQPRCAVVGNVQDVGALRYSEVVSRTCTLTNTGEARVDWFLAAPNAELDDPSAAAADPAPAPAAAIMPPWIAVHPTHGVLAPSQSVDITLRIGVPAHGAVQSADPTAAEQLVEKPGVAACSLSHLCVLRVKGGADHFVAVDGAFVPSFFGLTASTLARRAKAAAAPEAPLTPPEAGGLRALAGCPFAAGQWGAVPRQLQVLLQYLARDASLATPDLFVDSFQILRTAAAVSGGASGYESCSGQLPTVHMVMAAVDEGHSVPDAVSAHDVAATLLSYFKALPRSFFPEAVSTMCSLAMPDPNQAASFLKHNLGGPAEWALLCCTIHLLKLVLKAQPEADSARGADGLEGEDGRPSLRARLATSFAEVWFPAVSLRDIQGSAHAEDYTLLLQKAAEIGGRHAEFLQMFLV